jgi:sec-independent protein translocase protein TatA
MFNIGPFELMVILVVALLVVGPKRLPEVGRSIGRGLREFRKAQDEVKETLRFSLDDESAAPKTSEAAPTAAETAAEKPPEQAATDEITDVVRTLGRGLAELRKAREDVQRTFRVDLTDLPDTPSRSRSVGPPKAETTDESATDEPAPPAEAG